MGDHYQGVVIEYLRADQSLFLNTECCIQLNPGENPDTTGPHWYCDAVAANFGSNTIFLCEFSYSNSLQALQDRLASWNEHWDGICGALDRDSKLPTRDSKLPTGDWRVRPWLFVPQKCVETLCKKLKSTGRIQPLRFQPRITTLEMVQPWEYCSYNRIGEKPKPDCIPNEWQN